MLAKINYYFESAKKTRKMFRKYINDNTLLNITAYNKIN